MEERRGAARRVRRARLMEIVGFLRILARHRIAVTLGVVLAVVAGAATYMLSSKGHLRATAWGSVILAEPHTTPSALESKASGSLPDRATLLADLMTTESARVAIAKAAGLPAPDLAVRGPAMGPLQIPIPMPVAAQPVALPSALYTASVSTEDRSDRKSGPDHSRHGHGTGDRHQRASRDRRDERDGGARRSTDQRPRHLVARRTATRRSADRPGVSQ